MKHARSILLVSILFALTAALQAAPAVSAPTVTATQPAPAAPPVAAPPNAGAMPPDLVKMADEVAKDVETLRGWGSEPFSLLVVCQWIGNSQPVAMKHYLQVTDEHFREAA